MILARIAAGREAQLQGMRDRFNQPEPGAGRDLVLILALVACLVGLAYLLNRWQQRRAASAGAQPITLFRRVQRKLGLAPADRWRLWWLARVLGITHPTSLLISVRVFDDAVRRYCQSPGWFTTRGGSAPRWNAIRRRLFPNQTEP